MNILNNITNYIVRILKLFIFALLSSLVLLVFTQIVLRYLFNSGIAWAEEVSRYLFVYVVFLGIAIGIHEKSHIALEILTKVVEKYTILFKIIVWIAEIIFFGLILIYGIIFAVSSYGYISSLTKIRMCWVYMIVPISGGLSLLFVISDILINLNQKKGENNL